jgi:hypothetical protein
MFAGGHQKVQHKAAVLSFCTRQRCDLLWLGAKLSTPAASAPEQSLFLAVDLASSRTSLPPGASHLPERLPSSLAHNERAVRFPQRTAAFWPMLKGEPVAMDRSAYDEGAAVRNRKLPLFASMVRAGGGMWMSAAGLFAVPAQPLSNPEPTSPSRWSERPRMTA